MSKHKTREARLLERLRQLEMIVDAIGPVHSLIANDKRSDGSGAWQYFVELAALHHVATSGVRRPENLGTAKSHPQSSGTRLENQALRALKVELNELAVRALRVRATLQQIDPGGESGAEGSEPGLTMSSQTKNRLEAA